MSTGRIIGGRYRLKDRLGRGSFGVVWHADELLAGEPVARVAVKIFTAEVDRKEVSLLAGLSHPSILAYRAVVEDDGEVCLVTELADGGDAAARLRAWPDGLPADEVRAIVRSVVGALGHLHEQGWVHRDVKPANILFVRGFPKLGDVGTARALTSTARATSTASLAYAAPEVFSGKFGPGVDVYALGCAVYELLTGRLPFEGSMTELVHKHLSSDIEFPSDMAPPFVDMIRGCTVKEIERRWTVPRVLRWLDEERTTTPPPPAAKASPPAPPPVQPSAPPPAAAPAPAAAAPPPSAPPPPAAEASRTPRPTPLDPALRRHLRHHGDRWGDSDAWRAFMATAEATTRQHGLSERDLIRRAGQLLPEVVAAQLSEQETLARVGAWVVGRGGRRWSAPDWADFLDQINARDEAALARVRDALIARLYPPGPGATRMLDLGGGVQHLLVYAPLDKLYRPTTRLFDALRPPGGAAEVAGIWFSAQPLTVAEWSVLMAQPVPAGLKPDSAALAPGVVADAVITTLRRRAPADELRWPTMFEYDGVKWQRELVASKAAEAAAKAAQKANPLARRAAATPAPRRPTTLGGLVAQTVGKAAVDMLKEVNEAWLSDSGAPASKRAAMNLVSPVPRIS